jgi:Fe-Mn family superoxide dismutase
MLTRKEFLTLAAALPALAATLESAAEPATPPAGTLQTGAGPFTLERLPYDQAALAPFISAETVSYHYGKHHKGYVDNLNKLTAGKPEAGRSLQDLIMTAAPGPLFNNAAQAWNHAFYWNSLKPKGGGEPSGNLAAALKRDFGSFAKFRTQFAQAAASLFGSGWAWLVLEHGRLKVAQTSNADNPMRHDQTALLALDVWEHAYYIDYRNARAKYLDAVIDNLINWDFAAANYAQAVQKP